MSIIIKPIVTEKVTKESEVLNRFGSVVDKSK
jgi:large subunit ribosomal protein L23